MKTLITLLLLFALSAKSQDIPELNKRIVKTIGELLDSIGDDKLSENFIDYILEKNNARMPYNRIEIKGIFTPKTLTIYPGDIMQIDKLWYYEEFNDGEYLQTFKIKVTKVSGIIVQRINAYTFEIIRQDKTKALFKVSIPLNDMIKGSVFIYRPVLK